METPETVGAAVESIPVERLIRDAAPDYGVDVPALKENLGRVGRERAIVMDAAAARQQKALVEGYDEVKSKHEGIGPLDAKPWDADKERAGRVQSPLEAFGSAAGIFAMLASAFTKTPMDTALNAGAAAINSVRANDMDGYDKAHKAWKENTDLAIKRHQAERQAFQDAMQLYQSDPIAGGAELKAVAARFGAAAESAMIDAGYIEKVMEIQQAKAKAAQDVLRQMPNIERAGDVVKIANLSRRAIDEAQTKLGRPLTAIEQASIIGDVKSAIEEKSNSTPAGIRMTDATRVLTDYKSIVPDAAPSEDALIRSSMASTSANAPMVVSQTTAAIDAIKRLYAAGTPPSPEERLAALRGAAEQPLSEDAIQAAAERYLKTGTFPPNTGRGVQGRVERTLIQNKAAELARERGIDLADLAKNQQQFKAEQIAIQRFLSGPQGNTARSLNVLIDHLATAEQLGAALKNGDIPAINRAAQMWAEQTGQPAPTNLDTAKVIIGPEIIKALGIAGAGTQTEREEAASRIDRARSPQQFLETIGVIKKLLAGQVRGLRQQFKISTGLPESAFERMMLPETMREIGALDRGDKKESVALPESARAKLREGVETSFTNGQVWTLKNGSPVRIK